MTGLWEINCPVCHRSSWDGREDDESGERCGICGQLPAAEGDTPPAMRALERARLAQQKHDRLNDVQLELSRDEAF